MNDSRALTNSDHPVLQIRDLVVEKGGQNVCHVPALSVLQGERLGIIGPNGSGKTTLLRVLSGFETVFRGNLESNVPERERVFVHQAPYLFRGTVLQNVTYGLNARSVPKRERRPLALHWLGLLGIADLAKRHVIGLSGGEQRRTALARAFVLRPEVLLLDEPTADLDEAGLDHLAAALAELADATILIASPSPIPPNLVSRTVHLESPLKREAAD